ncbi:hypothetical protein [Pseudoalteromonas aliena]|uniref:DUF4868 domain-containing protein n=1 Tax=Pseudoalteromonas aliena SW19 TaxID=1314866 RepID=A0ABR9DU73_9GAMM|nr:hypothetical protein [Pseudoalteromonas aliena]MBE0357903.1 hypothetical protein [Pseudoalteromonas aliena SW19]
MEAVHKNLQQMVYTDDKGFGFEIIDDAKDNFLLQYVERFVKLEKFELTTGETTEVETVSYLKVKFGIRFNSALSLYVINPPRTMKHAFEMISTLFDKNLELTPVVFDLKALINDFSNKYKIIIKSISLSNIQCGELAVAKTKITTTKDLRDYFLNNYADTVAIVDLVSIQLNNFEVELARTGRLIINEKFVKNLLLVLEHSIDTNDDVFFQKLQK